MYVYDMLSYMMLTLQYIALCTGMMSNIEVRNNALSKFLYLFFSPDLLSCWSTRIKIELRTHRAWWDSTDKFIQF